MNLDAAYFIGAIAVGFGASGLSVVLRNVMDTTYALAFVFAVSLVAFAMGTVAVLAALIVSGLQ